MSKYRVITSKLVAQNLIEHTAFISNVSVEAAKRFLSEYDAILTRIENNPYEFQIDTSFGNPYGYRRAVFAKWYKCLFIVDESVVFLDAVVDCRKDIN